MDDSESIAKARLLRLFSQEQFVRQIVTRPHGPFESPAEAHAAIARYVCGLRRARGSRHQCMYPHCSEEAIAQSHVLPRRGVLDEIAENGHVLTPQVDHHKGGKLKMARIGTHRASVFPGFCEAHEQVFSRFEQDCDSLTSSAKSTLLQLFRTACREVRHREILISCLDDGLRSRDILYETRVKDMVDDHRNSIDDEVRERLLSKMSVRVSRPKEASFRERLTEASDGLQEFREDLLKPITRCVVDEQAPFSIIAAEIDERLPLCLAGQGNFHVDAGDGSGICNVRVLLNIWPRRTTTLILVGANSRHSRRLPYYIDELERSPSKLLRLIEAWALHGSDHWFLAPSHWRFLTEHQRQAILEAILDPSRSLAHEPRCHLFPALHAGLLG